MIPLEIINTVLAVAFLVVWVMVGRIMMQKV